MTPRPLDAPVVQAKLRSMRQLLADLDDVGPVDADRLGGERLLRHAVERVLIALVDLAVSVNSHVVAAVEDAPPRSGRESFALAARAGVLPRGLASELAPSVGLRNVLVHGYLEVDLTRVAGAVSSARDSYGRYVRAVAEWLGAR